MAKEVTKLAPQMLGTGMNNTVNVALQKWIRIKGGDRVSDLNQTYHSACVLRLLRHFLTMGTRKVTTIFMNADKK